MPISRPRRLRAALVTATLAAGLGTTVLPAATASPVSSAASAAPDAAGNASGFLLYMFPTGQVAGPDACTGIGLNYTTDPFINRRNCGFANFTVTGATGAITAKLFSEDSTTAFATPPTSVSDAATGEHQVDLVPDASWKAGKVTMVVYEGAAEIGRYTFFYNTLVAQVSTAGSPTKPGDAIPVTGTISEHTGGTVPSDQPAAATYKVRLADATGHQLYLSPTLTAAGGAINATIPGSATQGVQAGPATGYKTTLAVDVVDASFEDTAAVPPPATGTWAAKQAGTVGHTVQVPATDLILENKFVSSVGWVKPGQTYPSRIVVTNPTAAAIDPTSVKVTAPEGATILTAGGAAVNGPSYTWDPPSIAPGASKTLVLESRAATVEALDTIVWRDLSSTAVLGSQSVVSHGPKVIPPDDRFDTARYGDRPFPVVPVQYTDRPYQSNHSGSSLGDVINSPAKPGSTFNLYQEMSLGQLFPNGTVPSEGIASRGFDYDKGFDFTNVELSGPQSTCHGVTYEDLGGAAVRGTPLYPERITNGVYNLPGQTEYYGSDGYGSAVATSQTPTGIQDIDSGCGDTGKLVYDAAAIADPEIDYSDYDTDKDGVVDFFMVVFAGCGGNGASQLSVAGCDYTTPSPAPYDNIWPHSSSLEYGYQDPVTGLPGFTTDDQLKNLEGEPLWYESTARDIKHVTTTDKGDALKVYVRVGPYNVNPETAIDKASVISHEYGHSLGLPDFYTTSGRETYGDWNLMATDKSQNMDAFARQELGWVVPEVLDSSRTETAIPNSKVDIGTISWQKPNGEPYTLTATSKGGDDGIVHNSQMYVAKLPGRTLLDEAAFTGGDGATPSHLWWSGSGNDFGCNPTAGHNFDIALPELAEFTDPNATATLSFKSRWDIEWDFDYGFVLTTTDGGETYQSHPSQEGYTTGTNTVPPARSNNACQDTYSNGLTGSSGSYEAGPSTVFTDRTTGNYPPPVFLQDSYDVSDLTGAAHGALRFSYATDPGLARPGWFIDDVKITVDPDGPDGAKPAQDIYVTDFETSGDPADTRIFNGGCREDLATAQTCTQGWKYLAAGAESEQDHAYYMEMRDRSGFDFEGRGQIDRDPIGFGAGFYLAYTDEAHGYGNAGTDDPPAQSPIDSKPEAPGSANISTPNLNDAAFVDQAARATYSDAYVPGDPTKPGHTDNYTDPSSETGNWEFRYNCLGFKVDSMTGEDTVQEAGDLTGAVSFTMGSGCSDFDYGYETTPPAAANTAPVAKAAASPATAGVGQKVTLSAAGTTDAETPENLTFSWDFDNGGTTKDAVGKTVTVAYDNAGTKHPKVTVSDPQGLNGTATTTVTVTGKGGGNGGGNGGGSSTGPVAKLKIKPKAQHRTPQHAVRFKAKGSTGTGALTYSWNFHDGGKRVDASGYRVKHQFLRVGKHRVTLTVTDASGQSARATRRFRVYSPGHGDSAYRSASPLGASLYRSLF